MSSYTTELRYICEYAAGKTESVGYNGTAEVITAAIPKIFDFDFPIYDSTHKDTLCRKILSHYYTQEIAFETVGLWQFNLRRKMSEIMPYYNNLYEAAEMLKPSELLYTKNYARNKTVANTGTDTTTGTETATANSNTETNRTAENTRTDNLTKTTSDSTSLTSTTNNDTTSDTTSFTSDTPQGSLTDLTSGKYMTNGTVNKASDAATTENTSSGTSNSTETDTGTVKNAETGNETGATETTTTAETTSNKSTKSDTDECETITGYDGSRIPAEMFEAYRNAIIDVDMQIIAALSELFISIW